MPSHALMGPSKNTKSIFMPWKQLKLLFTRVKLICAHLKLVIVLQFQVPIQEESGHQMGPMQILRLQPLMMNIMAIERDWRHLQTHYLKNGQAYKVFTHAKNNQKAHKLEKTSGWRPLNLEKERVYYKYLVYRKWKVYTWNLLAQMCHALLEIRCTWWSPPSQSTKISHYSY